MSHQEGISLGSAGTSHTATQSQRADATANRALILETANQLFDEHGVATVTMAEVAKAAGVGKGTLYRRFANKGALCLAVMEMELIEFQNSLMGQLQEMTSQQISPVNQLCYFVDVLIYFMIDYIPYLYEINRDGVPIGSHAGPYAWQHLTIRGLLQRGIQRGELPATINPVILADMILAAIGAGNLRLLYEERGVPLPEISTTMQTWVMGLIKQQRSNDSGISSTR